jgi:hypothetical protein
MTKEAYPTRLPPMPQVVWFCPNSGCPDGSKNKVYYGG